MKRRLFLTGPIGCGKSTGITQTLREGITRCAGRSIGIIRSIHTAARLRSLLQSDENTRLYECRQFDEQALHLAEQWVKEYAHE